MKRAALLSVLIAGLTAALAPGANVIVPKLPRALAVGPNGNLYLADDARNQILERRRDGTFTVVATGLNRPGGMAFATDGTLYVADSGNDRVRAVSPGGALSTVAGNGRFGWVESRSPALRASIPEPADVKLARTGAVVIAADREVLRLARGVLTRIAGSRRYDGIYGIGGSAARAAVDSPNGLAFDKAGDLFLAGFATKALLMITPRGTMRLVSDAFYPRGDGGLVTAPGGTVLAMETTRLVRVSPAGIRTIADFQRRTVGGIRNFLPNGIAVAPNGDVYLDTDNGNGWVNRTALIVVHPNGGIRVLWEAPR